MHSKRLFRRQYGVLKQNESSYYLSTVIWQCALPSICEYLWLLWVESLYFAYIDYRATATSNKLLDSSPIKITLYVRKIFLPPSKALRYLTTSIKNLQANKGVFQWLPITMPIQFDTAILISSSMIQIKASLSNQR